MFQCKHCEFYKLELERSRSREDEMSKKLLALVDSRAFADVYQPASSDVSDKKFYNSFGEEVILAPEKLNVNVEE